MAEQEPYLLYADGSECLGTITDWGSGNVIYTVKNKPLKGPTRFQEMPTNDQDITFTLTFSIPDCGSDEYQKFKQFQNKQFTFVSEWGGGHIGYFLKCEPKMVIESTVYTFNCELLTQQ